MYTPYYVARDIWINAFHIIHGYLHMMHLLKDIDRDYV